MKQIRVFCYAQPYLATIREYFQERYGFLPSRRQTVLYSLWVVRDVPPGLYAEQRARFAAHLETFRVMLPLQHWQRLRALCESYGASLSPNMGMLATAIILYTALVIRKGLAQ